MIYLALSILCSSSIYILFKYFGKFNVQLLPAIVINYFIAASFGALQLKLSGADWRIPSDWWTAALIISLLFISLFYLMAKTAQELGVSVSSNASKMSMVIPILLLAIIYPEEHLNIFQTIGILLALFGIYFTSLKEGSKFNWRSIFWPFVLFIGTGILDFVLAYANQNLLHTEVDDKLFTSLSFGLAFIWGVLIMGYFSLKKGLDISKVSVVGGVVLGVVNFGSIFFLLRTYAGNIAQKTSILPINNMSIIIVSTLFSILLFKEKLSNQNILGLSISIASIVIIFYNS
jgi:drug/metabolite transporter (DMT)-like permease